MYPIYKFSLSVAGTSEAAYPLYDNSLAKEYEKESQQVFFRQKLTGELTFTGHDYDRIVAAAFDAQFIVTVYISQDAGQTWTTYWIGQFWKTNCTFDADDKQVTVTPEVKDQYINVLNALDKEFNLPDLAPSVVSCWADKRPVVQLYWAGDSVVYCLLPGMQWTEDCAIVSARDEVGGTNKLTGYYHFAALNAHRTVRITGNISPNLTGDYTGAIPTADPPVFAYYRGSNTIQLLSMSDGEGGYTFYYRLWQGETLMFQKQSAAIIMEGDLEPVAGSGATGTAHMVITDGGDMFARIVTDAASIFGNDTFDLPEDDMVGGIRKHSHVYPYPYPSRVYTSQQYSATPTKWGMYQNDLYYLPPGSGNYLPIFRNHWDAASIWFMFAAADDALLAECTTAFRLYLTYAVVQVVKNLLAQIDASITFDPTTDSLFLTAATNPVTRTANHGLLMTPKSYLVAGTFSSPALNANITLGQVLAMLRDCYRCYWYIDASNHFHIEHIKYFMNGLSYDDEPSIGTYLTRQTCARNGKRLDYGQWKFKYDKPAMTARYTFSWMDAVTQLFEGYPIEVVSGYVDKSKTENIAISHFTSDFDFLLLSGSGASRDGFALLTVSYNSQMGYYEVAYYTPSGGAPLQNGYVAFCYLQTFYAYDMPARNYTIDGAAKVALGMKKLKLQEVEFPAHQDPNTLELIQTQVGNGIIEKMSVNLCSRNVTATLAYDTEQ